MPVSYRQSPRPVSTFSRSRHTVLETNYGMAVVNIWLYYKQMPQNLIRYGTCGLIWKERTNEPYYTTPDVNPLYPDVWGEMTQHSGIKMFKPFANADGEVGTIWETIQIHDKPQYIAGLKQDIYYRYLDFEITVESGSCICPCTYKKCTLTARQEIRAVRVKNFQYKYFLKFSEPQVTCVK
jgi:hypothetical protein